LADWSARSANFVKRRCGKVSRINDARTVAPAKRL